MEEQTGWHLDKKVPLGLIAAIMVQTFAFGWWGAQMNERISHIEDNQNHQETVSSDVQMLKTQIAVMQQNIIYIGKSVERIEEAVTVKNGRK